MSLNYRYIMNKEEFTRRYKDTHTELQLLEASRETTSLVKVHPEDKGIASNYKIPGKALIESLAMEKRAEGLSHCLLDAISARVEDLMDIPMEKLVSLGIKTLPQKVDQKIDGNFTLINMIQKAHTVDAEQ